MSWMRTLSRCATNIFQFLGAMLFTGAVITAKFAAALVGPDVEQAFAMVQVIPVALLARQKDGERVGRPVGAQVARFRGVLGFALQEQVLHVPRLADPDIEQLVLIVVDLFELRGAQDVAPELVAALGDGVLGHQEERLVVGGPGDAT